MPTTHFENQFNSSAVAINANSETCKLDPSRSDYVQRAKLLTSKLAADTPSRADQYIKFTKLGPILKTIETIKGMYFSEASSLAKRTSSISRTKQIPWFEPENEPSFASLNLKLRNIEHSRVISTLSLNEANFLERINNGLTNISVAEDDFVAIPYTLLKGEYITKEFDEHDNLRTRSNESFYYEQQPAIRLFMLVRDINTSTIVGYNISTLLLTQKVAHKDLTLMIQSAPNGSGQQLSNSFAELLKSPLLTTNNGIQQETQFEQIDSTADMIGTYVWSKNNDRNFYSPPGRASQKTKMM